MQYAAYVTFDTRMTSVRLDSALTFSAFISLCFTFCFFLFTLQRMLDHVLIFEYNTFFGCIIKDLQAE